MVCHCWGDLWHACVLYLATLKLHAPLNPHRPRISCSSLRHVSLGPLESSRPTSVTIEAHRSSGHTGTHLPQTRRGVRGKTRRRCLSSARTASDKQANMGGRAVLPAGSRTPTRGHVLLRDYVPPLLPAKTMRMDHMRWEGRTARRQPLTNEGSRPPERLCATSSPDTEPC